MRPSRGLPLLLAACAAAADPDGARSWRVDAGVLAALTDADVAAQWELFKSHFARKYASESEEQHRRGVFRDNLKWVAANKPDTHGVTRFSDMTEAEFRATYLRPLSAEEEAEEAEARAQRERWDGESCESCRRFPEMAEYQEDSLDWSTKGAVTPVKDQGACDSCYAFGATGDMEGTWFLAGHRLVYLSEQELLSCVGTYNGTKQGCQGGTRAKMFKWVIDNGGIVTGPTYPYEMQTGNCNKSKMTPIAAKFDSYLQISDSPDGEDKIMSALNRMGPISIGISAARMELYSGGIISGSCATKHDHGPVIVGYGTDGAQKYWKIKNSWNKGWGEAGFFRAIRGQNICGMATDAVHSKIGGAQRYHCHTDTYTCQPADKGYSTEAKCTAACTDKPTAPPTPAPPPGPTPPPTPEITRYHCNDVEYQCYKVPPGGYIGGHSDIDKCERACFAPGYLCNTTTQQCYGVNSGGDKLHTCRDKCASPPTPVPVWTPAPPPPPRYHCDGIGSGNCVVSNVGHKTMEKCLAACK